MMKSEAYVFYIMNIGCIAVNSLGSKVPYIDHLIRKFNWGILGVCETQLFPSVALSSVAVRGVQPSSCLWGWLS